MAPRAIESRRPSARVRAALPGFAWATIAASSLISLGWWMAPSLSSRRVEWQWLAWIPDWAWAAATVPPALLGLLLAARLARGRWVAAAIAIAAVALPLVGVFDRDVGWTPAAEGPVVRVAFLNAQSPDERDSGLVLDALLELEADYLVVVNPGWIAREWRRRVSDAELPAWSVQWLSPVLLASRAGPSAVRTIAVADGIRAVSIRPPVDSGLPLVPSGGPGSILVVDLPSDPTIDRDDVADSLLASLAKRGFDGLDDFQLVLGDFNMTPRTPALRRLRGDLVDLVSERGDGWLGTWPRERPALRIDQAFAASAADTRVRVFDPGIGGHRGLLIEFPAAPRVPGGED